MGNYPSSNGSIAPIPTLKCPTPFVSADALSCVMPCPTTKQFVRQGSAGNYTCAYTPDPSKANVKLVTVGAAMFNGTTIDDLAKADRAKSQEFSTEKTRFENEMTIAYENIDKAQKINDAFKALQNAENVRDKAPDAYQAARTAYYTLLKGADWINEERNRVAAAEVAPTIKKYQDAVNAINVRTNEQQKTIDIVNGIKDRVLSLKDDFKYSVNTFSDQLEKVKIQINMENRSREKDKVSIWAWADTILNVLIVAVLLYAVYSIGRQYYMSWRAKRTTIRIPTYTAPVV